MRITRAGLARCGIGHHLVVFLLFLTPQATSVATAEVLTLDAAVDCGPEGAATSGKSLLLDAGEYEVVAVDGAWTAWGCVTCTPPATGWFWRVSIFVEATGAVSEVGSLNPRFVTAAEAEAYYIVDPGSRGLLSVPSTSVVWFWIQDSAVPGFCGDNAGQVTFTVTSSSDEDGDTISDPLDNCPEDFNPDQSDADDDGVGDACDNCLLANPGQADEDDNGLGDICDALIALLLPLLPEGPPGPPGEPGPQGPPGPQGSPGITPDEIVSILAQIAALQSDNATLLARVDALEATIATISELPTIRNLLDKATALEAEKEALKARVEGLEATPQQ